MAFWMVVAAVVVAGLLILAALSRIRIRVRYSRSGPFDHLTVVVRALYGVFRSQLEFPSITIRGWHIIYRQNWSTNIPDKQGSQVVQRRIGQQGKAGRVLRRTRLKKPAQALVFRTLKKVKCTRFRLDMRVGTGDAPSTAVISGLLWSVYGCVLAVTGQLLTLKTSPHGAVQPVYDTEEFSVVWEADFRIRLATVLWSGLRLGAAAIRMGRSLRYWQRQLMRPEPG